MRDAAAGGWDQRLKTIPALVIGYEPSASEPPRTYRWLRSEMPLWKTWRTGVQLPAPPPPGYLENTPYPVWEIRAEEPAT